LKLTTTPQKFFFFLFFGLVLLGAIYLISPFWQLIFVAAILAFFLDPVYRWLARKTHFKPIPLTALVYVALLLIVIIPLTLGIIAVGSQAAQLAKLLSSNQNEDLVNIVNTWLQDVLGLELFSLLEVFGNIIRENLGDILASIAGSVADLTGSIVNVFFGFIMFSFFFVIMLPNWERLGIFVVRISPLEPETVELYLRQTGLITRSVLLGTFGVAAIQAIILWLVLALLDIPFASLLALLGFFLALIPYIGMSLITIPLGIILILIGQWPSALVIWAVHFFIINNVDLVLRPFIMPKEIKAHSALIIFGLIGGLAAFGMVGLFLGPIIIILLAVSLEVYVENYGQPHIGGLFSVDEDTETESNEKET
jgi:predicted PurR-regulated permease PerM